MKWTVNDPNGSATNLRGRQGTNLTLINQGQTQVAAIGALTEAGNVVTVVLTNRLTGLQVGFAVTISGCTPDGYNGSFVVTSIAANGLSFTYTNPTAALGASTTTANITVGCDVYFDTTAGGSRLNASQPGSIPDGTRIAVGGGEVQFTDSPLLYLRSQVQTQIEIQP